MQLRVVHKLDYDNDVKDPIMNFNIYYDGIKFWWFTQEFIFVVMILVILWESFDGVNIKITIVSKRGLSNGERPMRVMLSNLR